MLQKLMQSRMTQTFVFETIHRFERRRILKMFLLMVFDKFISFLKRLENILY